MAQHPGERHLGRADSTGVAYRPKRRMCRRGPLIDRAVGHERQVVTTLDGEALTTSQLTSEEDPLQRGCIWMRGGQSDCRNLLDFIDVVRDADGRVATVKIQRRASSPARSGRPPRDSSSLPI